MIEPPVSLHGLAGYEVVISNLVLPEFDEIVGVISRVNFARMVMYDNAMSWHIRNFSQENVGHVCSKWILTPKPPWHARSFESHEAEFTMRVKCDQTYPISRVAIVAKRIKGRS